MRLIHRSLNQPMQKSIKLIHKWALLFFISALIANLGFADEYHVAINGDNDNPGTLSLPFRNINFAAQIARPGDIITVHEGTYREYINPPRGGVSPAKPIIYRCAHGEQVEIKGSEIIKGWEKFKEGSWKVTIPRAFFKDYNPYIDTLGGDWFNDNQRKHHPGQVYINGQPLYEASNLEDVLEEKTIEGTDGQILSPWYCENDEKNIYIYACFNNHNPNSEKVEINVRQSCFYPSLPGRNYITVTGFHFSQAATPWAPPTAEQIGMIGTHWSKGWVIKNNMVSHSRCVGITLGKGRVSGHNVASKYPLKDGATHYNEVIFAARRNNWNRDTIGSHLVENNTISNCGQAGIVGSLGAVFSTIQENHIYNIWTIRSFSGPEIAGIKIHAPIDTIIRKNHIHNARRGIWIDWMAQGTQIHANLLYNNDTDDLFTEVNHGPFLVDNNIFLSKWSISDMSEGGAFVHNLMTGKIRTRPVTDRCTPYHTSHSTAIMGVKNTKGGDHRFYNNIFAKGYADNPPKTDKKLKIGYGLDMYNDTYYPMSFGGNVYLNGANPPENEEKYVNKPQFNPSFSIVKNSDGIYLSFTIDQMFEPVGNLMITTEILRKAVISEQPFENPDGSPVRIDKDYLNQKRPNKNPMPGPFEAIKLGKNYVKVY